MPARATAHDDRHGRVTALLETRGLGRAFGALQAVAGVSLAVGDPSLGLLLGDRGVAERLQRGGVID